MPEEEGLRRVHDPSEQPHEDQLAHPFAAHRGGNQGGQRHHDGGEQDEGPIVGRATGHSFEDEVVHQRRGDVPEDRGADGLDEGRPVVGPGRERGEHLVDPGAGPAETRQDRAEHPGPQGGQQKEEDRQDRRSDDGEEHERRTAGIGDGKETPTERKEQRQDDGQGHRADDLVDHDDGRRLDRLARVARAVDESETVKTEGARRHDPEPSPDEVRAEQPPVRQDDALGPQEAPPAPRIRRDAEELDPHGRPEEGQETPRLEGPDGGQHSFGPELGPRQQEHEDREGHDPGKGAAHRRKVEAGAPIVKGAARGWIGLPASQPREAPGPRRFAGRAEWPLRPASWGGVSIQTPFYPLPSRQTRWNQCLSMFLRAGPGEGATRAQEVLATIGETEGFGWAQIVLTPDGGTEAETLCDWSAGRLPLGFVPGGSRESVSLGDYPSVAPALLADRAFQWSSGGGAPLSLDEERRLLAMGVRRLVALPYVGPRGLDGAAILMAEAAAPPLPEADLWNLALLCDVLGQGLLRQRSEERLRRSEARLRLLSDLPSEGVVVHDGHTILDANAAGASLLGSSVAELRGQPVVGSFVRPEDVPIVAARLAKADGRPIEILLRHPDGELIPVETQARTATLDGQMVRVASIRDLRAQKRYEVAIQEGEERLRRLLASTYDGVATTRIADRRIIEADEGCAQLFGYDHASDLLGLGYADLCSPESLVDVLAAVEGDREAPYEIDAVRRDGSRVPLEVLGCTVLHGGEPCRIAGFLDLTARRQLEAQRRQIDSRLQQAQKLESLGLLAGGIAHDFNNLLVGVLGNAELAALDLPKGHPARAPLDQVGRAALRASELTHQMLAYVGRSARALRPTDLNALVLETADLLTLTVPKRVTIHFELEPDLPAIAADASQIRQVVMNLLTNAGEAIGDAMGRVTLGTGAIDLDRDWLLGTFGAEHAEPGPYVYVRVADTGCGMDEPTIQRIFDPFFTTKFTGRGLGLAAVLGIVRSHGGLLKVRSRPGRGTTIWVALPATTESAVQSGDHSAISFEQASGPARVLLIDDEEVVRQVAAATLERAGYRVTAVADGEAGVEVFEGDPAAVDLVFLDLTMPTVPGEEVFHHLRSLRPELPILITSGGERPDFARGGTGPTDFLPKPFQTATLLQRVARLLGSEGQRS